MYRSTGAAPIGLAIGAEPLRAWLRCGEPVVLCQSLRPGCLYVCVAWVAASCTILGVHCRWGRRGLSARPPRQRHEVPRDVATVIWTVWIAERCASGSPRVG